MLKGLFTTSGQKLALFACEEEAAVATEYAVMLVLIIIGCFSVVQALGARVNSIFVSFNEKLAAAAP